MTEANPYPSEWLRGVLALAVQRVLAAGPTYGYAIAIGLEEAGFGTIKGGTLYPLLGRLEESGLVTAEWRAGDGGPGRKYYALTDQGRTAFAADSRSWTEFALRVVDFVAAPITTPGGTP